MFGVPVLATLSMVSLGEEVGSGLMVLASEIEDGVSMSMKIGSLAFEFRVRVEAESGLELENSKLQFFESWPHFFKERLKDRVSSFLFSSISGALSSRVEPYYEIILWWEYFLYFIKCGKNYLVSAG